MFWFQMSHTAYSRHKKENKLQTREISLHLSWSLKDHNIVNFMHDNTYRAYTTENNFKMDGCMDAWMGF